MICMLCRSSVPADCCASPGIEPPKAPKCSFAIPPGGAEKSRRAVPQTPCEEGDAHVVVVGRADVHHPHTADMAERLSLSPSPCKKLVPFLGVRVEEGVDGKRLKFLRDVLGARVWSLPLRLELKHSERRQLKTAGSVVAEKVVKLTQNAIFGRCCMNPDKFERAVARAL